MSDPSFERSRREEYYALYFETKILLGRVEKKTFFRQVDIYCEYKPIFHRFLKIF